jgi:hypothetical protein
MAHIARTEEERNSGVINQAGSSPVYRPPVQAAPPASAEAAKLCPESVAGKETVELKLRYQSSIVGDDVTVPISRKKLEEIMDGSRLIVADEKGPGFSPEEREAVLSGSQQAFSSKLNTAVQADQIVSMYESLLGEPLEWPTAYFTHYAGETDCAREKIAAGVPDQALKEKYESFIGDLSRSIESYRHDDKKVFITIRGGEERMPAFNAGRLEVNLTPYPSRQTGITTIHPADESESLAHELGHLCHASLRPGWDESKYSSPSDFETCALREAFADLTALFHILDSDDERQRVLSETDGDLTKSSRATRICEEGGGDMLYRYFDEQGTPPEKRFLRDINNSFVYVDRDDAAPCVPGQPSADTLSNDVYSYSQIFSGAVYDIITALHGKLVAQGMESGRALGEASRAAAGLLTGSVEISPWWKPDFKAMAQCMLETGNAEMREIAGNVFRKRNILSEEDIRSACDTRPHLPDMKLKDIPEAPEDALSYLVSRGLADGEKDAVCVAQSVRRTRGGEKVVVYSLEKPFNGDPAELPFDMSTAYYADICDLTPDVREKSSVVLKFDSSGSLIYAGKESFHPFDRSQHYLTLTK